MSLTLSNNTKGNKRISKLVSHLTPQNVLHDGEYVRQNFKLSSKTIPLKGKTIFITGASRGIGLAIAKKLASHGANLCIAAKTATKHPTLPGTIYTAAEQIESIGGKGCCLPVVCDIRSEENVKKAIQACVDKFGGVDILINNASAIKIQNTERMPLKRFDLIHDVNVRGTFLCTKYALPHLKKASNPHILVMSPPLNLKAKWVATAVGYHITKLSMSLLTLGWSHEFRRYNIGCNTLWPARSIATEAVNVHFGGKEGMRRSRNVDIMSDTTHMIITQPSNYFNGKFVVDEWLLNDNGITNLDKYKCDPTVKDSDLLLDFYVE